MTESEPKIRLVESTENTLEKKKKRFFSGLRNRLLALAAAGFITLGAGWGKDLSRQLEVEEKEATTELLLENEIKEDALVDFKERIEREEPEFAELAEGYRKVIEAELKDLEKEVIQQNISSPTHQEQDGQAILAEQQEYESGVYRQGSVSQDIDNDHKLIAQLMSDSVFLKDNHKFLNTSFDDIFWSIAFLNDSRNSRNIAAKFIKPPTIVFSPHSQYGVRRRADMTASFVSNQWQPKITLYPQAFMGPDKQINSNTYINFFIHELSHAFLAGSGDGKRVDRKMGNDFADVLDEGRVQGVTYKIVQYLNRNNSDLRPVYKEADGYDNYLIIAEIMESIARTHMNSDFLVEWQLGLIDYRTMLEKFKTAIDDLGLSANVYRSIVDFSFGENNNKASEKFLKDLLAELKLANKVNLSNDFIRSILTKGDVRY